MLVSGRVSQFSGVCHLHSCGPYYQSLVASSEETPVWDPCAPGYIWTNSPRPFWTSKTWRYVFFLILLFTHIYIYIGSCGRILIHTWITCPYHADVTSGRINWKPMGLYTIAMWKQRITKHWWLAIWFIPGIQERDTFAIDRCVNIRKFVGHPK